MRNVLNRWFPTLFPKKYQSESRVVSIDWGKLEKLILHKIKSKEMFREAFRHRSHPFCSHPFPESSNERLEFLGDALLNFYVGEFMYDIFPDAPEGDLTKMRSVLVSREYLARKGRELGIGVFRSLGEGEERSGGRNKDSILSNAVESLIGALYKDSGHKAVKQFIHKVILSNYESILESDGGNYKGDLLEYLQKKHLPMPKFITKKETGPDHRKTYIVAVKVGDETLGTGKGRSKKNAEQEAARLALSKINNVGNHSSENNYGSNRNGG